MYVSASPIPNARGRADLPRAAVTNSIGAAYVARGYARHRISGVRRRGVLGPAAIIRRVSMSEF